MATTEQAANTDDDDDVGFCVSILPRVSRTFALSIEALPHGLREAIRTGYLLCRISDTIEDDAQLDAAERNTLFDLFAQTLVNDDLDPAAFEAAAREQSLGQGTADGELCLRAGAIFRPFRQLPGLQRQVIRPRLLEMAMGMRIYCERAHREGRLRLRNLDDLERYCYYVAGTVGLLLTDLFVQAVPSLDATSRESAASCAVSFGLGLQLVNIVKDVAEDLERGVCFLPEDLANEQAVILDDILAPQHRNAGLAILRQVCSRATKHLEAAKRYTACWPLPEGRAVRLFCAVPLALALATLKEVIRSPDTLLAARTPKVSHAQVAEILRFAHQAVDSDQELWRLFDR